MQNEINLLLKQKEEVRFVKTRRKRNVSYRAKYLSEHFENHYTKIFDNFLIDWKIFPAQFFFTVSDALRINRLDEIHKLKHVAEL